MRDRSFLNIALGQAHLQITSADQISSNLTAAEDRVRELEALVASLLPGVNVDSVTGSIRQDATASNHQASTNEPWLRTSSHSDPAGSGRALESGIESLPREADGFDWAENEATFDGLADGMAALSVHPDGAGYLGKSHV